MCSKVLVELQLFIDFIKERDLFRKNNNPYVHFEFVKVNFLFQIFLEMCTFLLIHSS